MSDSSPAALVGVGVLLAGVLCVNLGKAHYNDHTINCHVTGKDPRSENTSYRVYTSNCGSFVNQDMWFRGKTNSADIQGQIEAGKTYRMHVVGWRFPLTSSFPNILSVQEVSQ